MSRTSDSTGLGARVFTSTRSMIFRSAFTNPATILVPPKSIPIQYMLLSPRYSQTRAGIAADSVFPCPSLRSGPVDRHEQKRDPETFRYNRPRVTVASEFRLSPSVSSCIIHCFPAKVNGFSAGNMPLTFPPDRVGFRLPSGGNFHGCALCFLLYNIAYFAPFTTLHFMFCALCISESSKFCDSKQNPVPF